MSTPDTLIAEFESLLKEKEKIEATLARLAPSVVAAGRDESVPVDVDALLAQIQTGATVKQVEVTEPTITNDRINGFRDAYVGQARQNAARIRKVVAAAAMIASKAVI